MSSQRMSRVLATQSECSKLLNRALIELEHFQIEGKLKDSKITAFEAQVKAADDLLIIYKGIAEDYKKAASFRLDANTIDTQKVKLYEDQLKSYERSISDYKTEIASLRVERDKLRTSRNWWTLGGILFGLGLGTLIKTKQ